jgi:diaminopimelate decarboxylase
MFKLAQQVKEKLGVQLTKIDLGGGLGFQYQPDFPTLTYRDFASAILTENKNLLKELGNRTIIFEPGRAIIADAGILLMRVEVVKKLGDVNWAIVDAGMNTFIRPVLYEAKHQVVAVNKTSNQISKFYDLGGPCYESGDIIARDAPLPELEQGDLLTVLDVGAYGFAMSSNYNGQPRPAVMLVSNEKAHLIRRRESYEDLVAGETIPSHLSLSSKGR